jgi:hypothetical protein
MACAAGRVQLTLAVALEDGSLIGCIGLQAPKQAIPSICQAFLCICYTPFNRTRGHATTDVMCRHSYLSIHNTSSGGIPRINNSYTSLLDLRKFYKKFLDHFSLISHFATRSQWPDSQDTSTRRSSWRRFVTTPCTRLEVIKPQAERLRISRPIHLGMLPVLSYPSSLFLKTELPQT